MTKLSRNFVSGKMNKSVDERLVPDGEYIDAMNVRMGSTEHSEIGVIENTKGNAPLTKLYGPGNVQLSINARCIGSIADSATNTIYWFVHDGSFTGPSNGTSKCDMIVSYNILSNVLTYHVVSTSDGSSQNTTLNFNDKYLITGVNIIENLLFFTDDYNQPRVINVKRTYLQPSLGIDQITNEELLVIKRPPIQAPTIFPYKTSGQENYIDSRFISFAYRYRYIDGEYSATSQWSDIAFVPGRFNFSIDSMLNEGMSNSCNSVDVTYNSGSNLVVGIDLLFKQSANNVIKIIEKIDKSTMGLSDNTDYTFVFDSSKIFTIIPDSELLRLYDNVPLQAKAQTIMGNRIMYGNYVEGYDLIDKDSNPLMLEYSASLITDPVGEVDVPSNIDTGTYTLYSSQTSPSILSIDMSGLDLVEGAAISVILTFTHYAFNGGPAPVQQTDPTNVDFLFILPTNYSSVYQMATSAEFQQAVGTSLPLGNIKPVWLPTPGSLSCDGYTFTDGVNCSIPNNLDALIKVGSGISGTGQAISIITSPASTVIGLQLPAMKYVDNTAAPTNTVYEYYEITYRSIKFQKVASPKSLHSNRDYEIGIVYMDEYNRASTALVSPYNTIHIPCAYSTNSNGARITIPPTQVAPYWASRYKFVIKASGEFYETIYSSFFVRDPDTNEAWFFLEGENGKKVETGDRLIVKSDSAGPARSCTYVTVLEKAVKSENFITPAAGLTILGGVYMKINPNSFNAVEDPEGVFTSGQLSECAPCGGTYSAVFYPVNRFRGAGFDPLNPTWEYEDVPIPAGSRITVNIEWNRQGRINGNCEPRGYVLNKTYTALSDYSSFEDWFNGDNIQATLNTGSSMGPSPTSIDYIPTVGVLSTFSPSTCYLQFDKDITTNKVVLQMGTGQSCTGGCNQPFVNVDYKKYCVTASIVVYSSNSRFIFETEPSDSLPDVFFENNLSFAIDSNGNHMGNVQDQNISSNVPAIVDTEFFNCFAFGNGAESYKIRDSIVGRYFTLGERVNTVSAQNYKRAHRFSDITYSGVYNPETNVNKLNEFNLGLVNYKNLEASFGPVYVLDGRQTDVLVLQEDKISYVLAGKNLLSDSAAGGAISSVPQVLGTQIARIEKYGISFNPESYTHWGYYRYFTDVKRGVVIGLIGDSSQQDQLSVVSDFGMRTWFRDEFNESFNTQKLGGYDPYMNEYVLSSNNIRIPYQDVCVGCGLTQTISIENAEYPEYASKDFCVNLGPYVGDASVSWAVISNPTGEEFNISVSYLTFTYDGPGFNNYPTGTIIFPKTSITDQTANITITCSGPSLVIDITPSCPDAALLNIVEVVLTNNADAGNTTHIEYRYTNGAYASPLQSIPVTFGSGTPAPVVSRYNMSSGFVGAPGFPPPGSTVRLQSNKILPDTYNFNNANDKFRWHTSNTLYPNTFVGIQSLLAASTLATPIIGSSPIYYANFTFPFFGTGSYLYLIWDYRDSTAANLCYTPCEEPCITVTAYNPGPGAAEIYFPYGDENCGGEDPEITIFLNEGMTRTRCIDNNTSAPYLWQIISGQPDVYMVNCGCGSTQTPQRDVCCGCVACSEPCITITIFNSGSTPAQVYFPYGDVDCGGFSPSLTITLAPGESRDRCIKNVMGVPYLWQIIYGQVQIDTLYCGCGSPPSNVTPPSLSYSSLLPGDTISINNGSWA